MSDQVVNSRAILDTLLELQRVGVQQTLCRLEQVEPDLAAYAMETLSVIYGDLTKLGGRAKPTARVFRDVRALVLVCIGALRNASYEHWRREAADTPLGRLAEEIDELASDEPSPLSSPPAMPPPPRQEGGTGLDAS